MLDKLRQAWKDLKASGPGHRFQDRYDRSHDEGEGGLRRGLVLAAGIAILLAGLFFLPAPGPGTIILALGGALIARESRRAAKLLDAIEVKLRAALAWGKASWDKASLPLRTVVIVVAVVLGAAAAWTAWRVLFA